MNFASDNVSPFCPEVLEALSAEASHNAPAYGGDDISQQLDRAFSEMFDTDVAVIPVATGTAANCISLSALVTPYGGVVCHHEAHINEDESTGVAFFTGGAKLLPMDGPTAKLEADALDAFISGQVNRGVHSVAPECVAITQATELGTVYTPAEVAAIGEVCKKHDLRLFMDGARFANAVAHLDCRPADITWKAGVDAISFGATKNGAMAVDAIVLFDTALKSRVEQARKRSGHLHSKHRYLATQLLAYVKNDVWLKNAAHANQAATALANILVEHRGTLAHPADGNELFVKLAPELADRLRAAGVLFHAWPSLGADIYRFVAAWNTDIAQISTLKNTLG
ncbi:MULTISPECIES: threonine aldolase family protein [Thalassospira]|uniref:Threonine aldolase n=2 Tax=Thalassospira TaxID=168934 RepID=A0A367W2Q1_9PROT|nr:MULTISPECIES: beta-eliminating lyase-related protein [Thalassospira]MDG4718408.1 beta-eliminating lyase-related protein [Thalassospira sp. FZY0004]RCK34674.1 threonine aldolase [Thalassospira profundimaris]